MALLKKIKQTGLAYSFAILFNRVVPQWLFRCRRFVVYQLDPQLIAESMAAHPQDDAIQIRWCQSELDYSAAETVTYFQRSLSTGKLLACVAEQVDESPTADAATNDSSQLAGGLWAATEQFDESDLGVRILLKPDQVWLFAAVVAKPFRRRGIYSQILAFIVAELATQEINQTLVAVNPRNIGSHAIHQQFAGCSRGTVFAMRFLQTSVCFSFGDLKRDRTLAVNSTRRPIEISVAK